ncbi:unnamed protein product, partial [Vitis vinifera]|uniref:USP domain-containing protein n=1 Tax=Vitis vinifera TaxID=29760 RepID=D7SMT1_VITVI
MRVIPLRNFFLILENYKHCNSPLIHRFQELTRRYWHPWNCRIKLKSYTFLNAVTKATSNNRYQMGVESDPIEFMAWLLNSLHVDLRT